MWFPTSVPDDWAPYRFGHWDWIEPWGWTWVDDQPWGFAPFHYGRWVNIDGHWGWVPGAVQPHPVYAPALVAFVDAPDDSDNGPDGGPDVGWFPLGPGDDYAPWYQAGPDYVASVNAPEHGHFHDSARTAMATAARESWRGAILQPALCDRGLARGVCRRAPHRSRNGEAGRLPIGWSTRRVMRGAPHVTPAVFRTPDGPGEFRGEPHGATPAAAAADGLHARPGGAPGIEHEPGMAARGAPALPQSAAASGRKLAAALSGAAVPRRNTGVPRPPRAARKPLAAARQPAERGQSCPKDFAARRNSAGRRVFAGFRGAQQFGAASGVPGVSRRRAAIRPARRSLRGFAAAPSNSRGLQVAQGFRGGAQQFGRPQVFQTPAASYRGGGMMGRAGAAGGCISAVAGAEAAATSSSISSGSDLRHRPRARRPGHRSGELPGLP